MDKKVAAAIICALLFFSVSMAVYANSAQTRWTGVDATGTMIIDEESPIVVEKELLTFDLLEFPANYYGELDEYLAYTGKVTAEYTFYNPSDYTVTATLLFPFGKIPDYGYTYDYDTEQATYNADINKYGITVNGEVIDVNLRHTLSNCYEQFNVDVDLPKVVDGYVNDKFYKLDTPVYCQTYTVSGIDEKYNAATASIVWNGDDTKTKIYIENQSGGGLLENGVDLHLWADNGEQIKVWIIGEYEELPEWTLYENGACEKKIEGTVTKEPKEPLKTMTFKDYALQNYTIESGVLENDWYNAIVAGLNEGEWEYGVISLWDYNDDLSNSLLRWYEYEITLKPGERIVNTVTAPIYPSIDLNYEPSIFSYTYLLSPAQTWADFGTLDIVINTPYYIADSNLDGFVKKEEGYTLSLAGLPDGELEFTLSTSENPKAPIYVKSYGNLSWWISIGVLIIGGIVLIVLKRMRSEK